MMLKLEENQPWFSCNFAHSNPDLKASLGIFLTPPNLIRLSCKEFEGVHENLCSKDLDLAFLRDYVMFGSFFYVCLS